MTKTPSTLIRCITMRCYMFALWMTLLLNCFYFPRNFARGSTELPPWNEEFWTPIEIRVDQADPQKSMVTLCKLNFKKYSESPNQLSKFKDLVEASACRGKNKYQEELHVLMEELKDKQAKGLSTGNVVPPTGFVFHESRVGSTLVANLLASDPWSIVFSESQPIANALLHCHHCSREDILQLIRDVVTLMGRSPNHKRLFFKFQSIASTKMNLILDAFPDIPWSFVFRQPVQTMMSHMDPHKGGSGAPCLRSMKRPTAEVEITVAKYTRDNNKAPREAWCAAHLNMLCQSAIKAYEQYANMLDSAGNKIQRGLMVNYDSLPGILPKAMLPLFNSVPDNLWLANMAKESKQYSKSRGKSKSFKSDSKDKDNRATEKIQKFAQRILMTSYEVLNNQSAKGLRSFMPTLHQSAIALTAAYPINISSDSIDWGKLRSIP